MWECEYTVPRELGSKNVILPWGFHHTLFSVTLCLLVATEKLPARAVWKTICWSYLMTTCRSIVTIHFMNCVSNSLRFIRRSTGTFWRPNVILFAGVFAHTYAPYLKKKKKKITWLKLQLENYSQELRNAMSSLWDW